MPNHFMSNYQSNQSFETKGIKTFFEIASTRSSAATPQQS